MAIKIVEEDLNPKKIEGATNDCSIRSIAKILGLSWDEVYMHLSNIGFKKKMLMNSVQVMEEFLGKYDYSLHINRTEERQILKSFLNTLDNGKYIIVTKGHCFAFINGVIYDKNTKILNDILSKNTVLCYFYKNKKEAKIINYESRRKN